MTSFLGHSYETVYIIWDSVSKLLLENSHVFPWLLIGWWLMGTSLSSSNPSRAYVRETYYLLTYT